MRRRPVDGVRARAVAAVAVVVTTLLGPIATSRHSFAVTDQQLGLFVGSGFYPSDRDSGASTGRAQWNRVTDVGTDVAYVATPDGITATTASGSDWIDFVARQQRIGQTVLATVEDYGSRTDSQILAVATSQRNTFKQNGILLRGYSGLCTAGADQPGPALIASLRSLGFTTVAVSVWAQPESCYGALTDVLVFERSKADYPAVTTPAWRTGSTPKLWHVVTDVAQAEVVATVALSKTKDADVIMTVPGPSAVADVPDQTYWDVLRAQARNGAATPTVNENFPYLSSQKVATLAYGLAYPNFALAHTLPTNPFDVVVINPDTGVGGNFSQTMRNHVDQFHSEGKSVLGYIPVQYMATTDVTYQSSRVTEAQVYINRYNVDGFFIDEVLPGCDTAGTYLTFAARIRQELTITNMPIVMNPGRNVGECLVSAFDAAVTFEGTMADYRAWRPSTWNGSYPASKFWQLVHTTTTSEIAEASNLSKRRQAGHVWVTTLTAADAWTHVLSASDVALLRDSVIGGPPRNPAPQATTPASSAPRNPAGQGATQTTLGRGPAPQAPGDGNHGLGRLVVVVPDSVTTTTSSTTTTTIDPSNSEAAAARVVSTDLSAFVDALLANLIAGTSSSTSG